MKYLYSYFEGDLKRYCILRETDHNVWVGSENEDTYWELRINKKDYITKTEEITWDGFNWVTTQFLIETLELRKEFCKKLKIKRYYNKLDRLSHNKNDQLIDLILNINMKEYRDE